MNENPKNWQCVEAIWCDIEEFSSDDNRKYHFPHFLLVFIALKLDLVRMFLCREDLSVQEKT